MKPDQGAEQAEFASGSANGGPAKPEVRRGPLGARRRYVVVLAEIVGVLLLWEVLGLTVGITSHILPTPVAVLGVIGSDRTVLLSALRFTSTEALWGFVVGDAVAVILGALSVLNDRVASVVVQLGVVSYCLPVVAVGPILIILLPGTLPDEVLAGVAVVFTTLVMTIEGLQSATRQQRELVLVFGGSTFDVLRRVRLRASIPYIFRGLQIAAPASVLGAIIGEFLSGSGGLGVVIIQAAQALQVNLTWAAGAVATAAAALVYALISVVARVITPWAREVKLA